MFFRSIKLDLNKTYFQTNTSNIFRRFCVFICFICFSSLFSQIFVEGKTNLITVSVGVQIVSIVDGETIYISDGSSRKTISSVSIEISKAKKEKPTSSSVSENSTKNYKNRVVATSFVKKNTQTFKSLSTSDKKISHHVQESRVFVSVSNFKFKFYLNENFSYSPDLFLKGKNEVYFHKISENRKTSNFSYSIRPPPFS